MSVCTILNDILTMAIWSDPLKQLHEGSLSPMRECLRLFLQNGFVFPGGIQGEDGVGKEERAKV